MLECITDDTDISSDSDREDFDEENSNEVNSHEEDFNEENWLCNMFIWNILSDSKLFKKYSYNWHHF